jgi:hypothetical protein
VLRSATLLLLVVDVAASRRRCAAASGVTNGYPDGYPLPRPWR